ncbi:hypothetical protein ACFX13_018820 [Malus domestica]
MCLTLSWNATAANGPMFVEVVLVKHQTTKPFLELYQRRCLVTMQNLWIHARLKGWASSDDDGSSTVLQKSGEVREAEMHGKEKKSLQNDFLFAGPGIWSRCYLAP